MFQQFKSPVFAVDRHEAQTAPEQMKSTTSIRFRISMKGSGVRSAKTTRGVDLILITRRRRRHILYFISLVVFCIIT